jgi:hypothetical protein
MKNFFATLCALIIIFLFPLVTLLTVVQLQLSGAENVQQLVRDAKIAEQVPDLIITKMQESEGGSEEGLSEEEILSNAQGVMNTRAQIANALPPETVNAIFDQVIDDGAVWWKSDAPLEEFPLVLNIAPFKDEVKPLLKNTELITDDDGGLPDTIDLEALLTIESQNKPDEFVKYNEQINAARISIGAARTLTIIGWIVIGLSFLGIGLLVRTPVERVAKWFGWVGVVTVLQTATLLAAIYFLPSFIQPVIGSNGLPSEIALIFSVVEAVSTALWHGLAVVTFVLILLVVVAFGIYMKLTRSKK